MVKEIKNIIECVEDFRDYEGSIDHYDWNSKRQNDESFITVVNNIKIDLSNFVNSLLVLCKDDNKTKEDIKNLLLDHKEEINTIEEINNINFSCNILTTFQEWNEENYNCIESEVKQIESDENWRLYDSLK
jgi:hypothetical protein